jgi:type II secretory pathway component PulF
VKFSPKNLGAFYYQLGTLVQAGLPIQSALASTQKTAPRAMRPTVEELSKIVNTGAPLHEAMEHCGRRFAAVDRYCVGITERSGALDAGLLSLSNYYDSLSEARRKLIVGSLYPAFLLTAAVFVIPLPTLVIGKMTVAGYLWQTAGLLARLAAGGWIVWQLLRLSFALPGLNVVIDRVVRALPVLGRLRFDYALSQWLGSIRLMLAAGIGVLQALEYASASSPSPLIAAAYKKATPLIGSELDVSQALAMTGEFPDDLIQLWATGEKSGRMDEMLERLAKLYEERWRNSLELTITWLPRITYFLVMLFVAWQIVSLYTAYLNTYDNLLQ